MSLSQKGSHILFSVFTTLGELSRIIIQSQTLVDTDQSKTIPTDMMMPGNFDDQSIPDFIVMMNYQPEKLHDQDFDDVAGWWQDSVLSLCHDDDSVSQVSDGDANQDEGSHHCHCNSEAPRRGSINESCTDCGLPPVPSK